MTFTWIKIPNFPYEAGSDGTIRNSRTGRVLKPDVVKRGYQRVTLSLRGVTHRAFVNRLVCEAFHGAPPTDEHHARHLDGDTSRNDPENLKWGTPSENEQDKKRHGTFQERERNPAAKMTEDGVADVRRRYSENLNARKAEGFQQVDHGFVMALADEFDVSVSCIKFVLSRRNWPEQVGS